MTWTASPSNADLKQSADVRAFQMVPERQALRTSSALTRPRFALQGAVCVLSLVALVGVGTVPATADDGDTAEASLVEELASDAASENAREAKEGLDNRRDSDRRGESRQQNRADQESRENRSIKRRQENRARDEIKDAVTNAYLNTDDGATAAEEAADDAADSASATDVGRPGVKPDFPGASPGVLFGLGSHPGIRPDIYGAEVAGNLGDQIISPIPNGETADAQGDLGKYAGMPSLGQGSGTRLGAGYGGIFGSLAGVEAPSGSSSGAMLGSDEWDDDETLVIVNDKGEEVNRFEAGELDVVTGPNHDWHTDPETGDIKITENDSSDSGQDTAEFGEEHAIPEDSEENDDEDVMKFDKDDTENKGNNDDDSNVKSGGNEDNEGSSDTGDNSDDSDTSDNGDNTNQGDNEENAGNDDGGDSDSEESTKKADEDDTLPCRMPAGGACSTSADPEEIQEEVSRSASHSRTTMPAEPDAEGELGLELPWGISRLPEKTTTPVRPGSMHYTATPLPLSVWNPGTIDPHRGN